MRRYDGNGITFDGLLEKHDVCAMGRTHQPAHSTKAGKADILAPFRLVYGDLRDLFTLAANGGYKYVSKIADQSSRWTTVYLLCGKDRALSSFQAYITSPLIPFSSRIVRY